MPALDLMENEVKSACFMYSFLMGRGIVEDVFRIISRRDKREEKGREEKEREEKELLQADTFLLLGLDKREIPSIKEIDNMLNEIRKSLEEQGGAEMVAEVSALDHSASSLSSLERVLLKDTLLSIKADYGILSEEEKLLVREGLPEREYSDHEAALIQSIRRSLPFLKISGQSIDSFRAQLSDRFALDLEELGDDEILALIVESEFKDRDDSWRTIRLENLSSLLQGLPLSRLEAAVGQTEKMVRDNLSWAVEMSQVGGRRVKHPPLVIGFSSLKLTTNYRLHNLTPGMMCPAAGRSSTEMPVIISPDSQTEVKDLGMSDELYFEFLKEVMVHEMIHDTQDLISYEREAAVDVLEEYNSRSFIEGLTQGLVSLRLFRDSGKVPDNYSYLAEVATLFQMLEEAGVEKREYEDRIHYLNSVPVTQALAAMAHWRGEEPKVTQKKFSAAIKDFRARISDLNSNNITEKEERDLVDEVFGFMNRCLIESMPD